MNLFNDLFHNLRKGLHQDKRKSKRKPAQYAEVLELKQLLTGLTVNKARNDLVNIDADATSNTTRGNVIKNDRLAVGNRLKVSAIVNSRGVKRSVPKKATGKNIAGKYGTLKIYSSGAFVYRLKKNMEIVKQLGAGKKLIDSFTYTAKNNQPGHIKAKLRIRIMGVNSAPVAVNDSVSTTADQPIIIYPIQNDFDINTSDKLTITRLNSDKTNGDVSLDNGEIVYNPRTAFKHLSAGETAIDTFWYTLDDGKDGTAIGSVVVTVVGVNQPPQANNDFKTVTADMVVNIDVLKNDTDVNQSDRISISSFDSTSALGAEVRLVDNQLRYNPTNVLQFLALAEGDTIVDTFKYLIEDGQEGTNEGIASLVVHGVDNPPVLNPIGNQSIAEQTELTFTATATDVDQPAGRLTFSLVGAPAGATIDPETGLFHWLPSEADGPGEFTFEVVVTDSSNLSASEMITVTVGEVDNPPVLNPIGNQSIAEQTELTFTATATDVDQPAGRLRFSLVGAPAGASIDPETGLFHWLPSEADGPGEFTFEVVVTDSSNLSASEMITVTVGEVDNPPVLNPIGNQSIAEQTELTFTATAADVDQPAGRLTFSLVGAPAGASIDPETGLFHWLPSEADGPGEFTFEVVVTDSSNLSASEMITVTVGEVDNPPVLNPIGNQSIAEQTELTFTATAADVDQPAGRLTFSLVGAPAGASIDPETGLFHWLPSEADGPGEFTFEVVVTDSSNLSASEMITVTVGEVDNPPVVTGDLLIEVLETLSQPITLEAYDPEEKPLTFTISGGADEKLFAVDQQTGELVFNFLPDYESPQDADRNNEYEVLVKVTDPAGLSTEQLITVKITNAVDHMVVHQTYEELSYIEASVEGRTFYIAVEGIPEGSKARIIGKNDRSEHGRYTGLSPDFDLPVTGTISFTLDRIPGWAPQLAIITPTGPSHGHGTGILFGEVIDAGRLLGVHGGGSAYFGGDTGTRTLSTDHDPVFSAPIALKEGLDFISALIRGEEKHGQVGEQKTPAYEIVIEKEKVSINLIEFVNGFELVVENVNGEHTVLPLNIDQPTEFHFPDVTTDFRIYLRDIDDVGQEVKVGKEYVVSVTAGQANQPFHRKVILTSFAYYEGVYNQLLHAADQRALVSSLEELKTTGSPDLQEIRTIENSLRILQGDITLFREADLFTTSIPWDRQFFDVRIDEATLPAEAIEFAEIDEAGIFRVKLRDDYIEKSFDISFIITNGEHARTVTTTFQLVTREEVFLQQSIDQLTEFVATLESRTNKLSQNYNLAENMESEAGEVLDRYLQQTGDPSQLVSPEFHVQAVKFHYNFQVIYKNVPESGYQLRLVGGKNYTLEGRDGIIVFDSLPRPDGTTAYSLELVDANGEIVQRVTEIKISGGRISRVGAKDQTYKIEGLAHIPPLAEELHVTPEQKAAADQQIDDAASLRITTDEQIATLNQLRETALQQIEDFKQQKIDYLNRLNISRDSLGDYFKYFSTNSDEPVTVRAWKTAEQSGQLIAYESDGKTAFKFESRLASVDFSALPGAVTELFATVKIEGDQQITAHFFRGGKEVSSQVISHGDNIIFSDSIGISALVLTSTADTTFHLSKLMYLDMEVREFSADPLSGAENILIARGITRDWGNVEQLLIYPRFEHFLADNGIINYRPNGMDGPSQGQYYLLGYGSKDEPGGGKYTQYTLFTPESTESSPKLGRVKYFNDNGIHDLSSDFYTLVNGAIIIHPGAPTAIAVQIASGQNVRVNYRDVANDIDDLLNREEIFAPLITVQKLYRGHHANPRFHNGITEIQDGETPVLQPGEQFHALVTINNTSGISETITIEGYASLDESEERVHLGSFTSGIGAYQSYVLIVNATAPHFSGGGRPEILFEIDGQLVAGKHGRKEGRGELSEEEKQAIREGYANALLEEIARQHGLGSEQYESSRMHLEDTLNISIPPATTGGENEEGENNPDTPDETPEQEIPDKIVLPDGDILSQMTPETLQRIADLATKAQTSALERGNDQQAEDFGKLLEAANGLLADPNSSRRAEWIAVIERMTTDPADNFSSQLSRWWATAGDEPIETTWTVEIVNAGKYRLQVDGYRLWKLGDALLFVDGRPLQFSGGFSSFEMLSVGTHHFKFQEVQVPTIPGLEEINFQLWEENELEQSLEFNTTMIADHPKQFEEASSFRIAGADDPMIITGVNNLVNVFAPILHFSEGEDYPMPVSADGFLTVNGVNIDGNADSSFDLNDIPNAEGKVYASVIRNPNNITQLAINYFFFYPRSNWSEKGGRNTHDGDWEGVTIFFEMNGDMTWVPQSVAMAQHVELLDNLFNLNQTDGGERVPWNFMLKSGYQVHLFVGLGGHATYSYSGETSWLFKVEDHHGTGSEFNASNKVEYLSNAEQEAEDNFWLLYTGIWGAEDVMGINELGDTAPRGPLFSERWFNPWSWSDGFNWIFPENESEST